MKNYYVLFICLFIPIHYISSMELAKKTNPDCTNKGKTKTAMQKEECTINYSTIHELYQSHIAENREYFEQHPQEQEKLLKDLTRILVIREIRRRKTV